MKCIKDVATIAVLAGALTLAGCNVSDSSTTPGTHQGSSATSTSATESTPATDHNDADVTFATDMIPHHRQAVDMSDIALRKSANASIKRLSSAIKAAQDPEIQQMSGWLANWGEPVPTPSPGADHGGHTMPGMMSEQEMAELGKASGAAFDRMFLQMMIRHHQGAVTMASTEQAKGKNTQVIALARKIETDQNREIATMRTLLTRS